MLLLFTFFLTIYLFLVLLWQPVSDRTVFAHSRASEGSFAIFPISHTVNNSTFNIKNRRAVREGTIAVNY